MTTKLVPAGVASSGLTVSSGVDLIVNSGGLTSGTQVLSGGLENLLVGALAESITVSAGGRVSGSGMLGGTSYVYGVVSGATVVESGLAGQAFSLNIMSGGQTVGVTVDGGAFEAISAGGLANGGLIRAQSVVFDYGKISAATVSNGNIFVQAGGTAANDVIENGGFEVVDWSGDATAGMKGGVATSDAILSGGVLEVSSGGVAVGAHVQSGGVATAYAGAQTSRTVLSGGTEYDYGQDSGSVLYAGGEEFVESGGTASHSVISSGGHEIVLAGGVASGATVSSGGILSISGGSASGGLTIAGGRATITGKMAAGQTVTFATSAGVLELANLAAFGAKISGLSSPTQKIDLDGFVYSSAEKAAWAQTGTSGTLTVTDGAKTAHLTLIGTYATGNFTMSADGHGGTFVVDPPLTTGGAAGHKTAGLVQAMAVFGGGSAAGFTESPRNAAFMSAPALIATASAAH